MIYYKNNGKNAYDFSMYWKRCKMKKFIRVFFYCTSITFLNLAMQFAAAVLLMFLAMIFRLSQSLITGSTDFLSEADINTIAHDILLPSFILAAILTFGIAWLAHVIFKKPFIKRLSIKKASFAAVTVAFVIGCSLQMPIVYIMDLIHRAGVAPELFDKYAEIMEPLTLNQNIVLQIIAIGIVGPLLEEVIFRGLIFHQLRKNVPLIYAIILQAALFAISHLNVIQGTYAFFIGILLALSFVWSRSLLLPIAIHIGMNLSGILLSEYGDYIDNTSTYTILVFSVLLIIAGTAYLYSKSRSSEEEMAL
jgi:membrane protease YdiL (CAAX protease family)